MKPIKQEPDSAWAARRVLVTGADGFVGRWLVPALAAHGARVWALVRPGSKDTRKIQHLAGTSGVEIVYANLPGILEIINKAAIDTVYHLAANNSNRGATVSAYELFETNIRGTYIVLEACRTAHKPVGVVLASSTEAEDCFRANATRKFHPYMASKAAAELVARACHDSFGIPLAIARSANVYGGGDFNWSRLVPGTIRSILLGEAPVIRSNGLLQRDYVYVEDAVAAYIAIGERLNAATVNGKLFRLASGLRTTVLDVVERITRAAGRPDLKPQVLNEKMEGRIDADYVPELERNVLGWKCQFSLDEGLSRTCRWYQDLFSEAPVAFEIKGALK